MFMRGGDAFKYIPPRQSAQRHVFFFQYPLFHMQLQFYIFFLFVGASFNFTYKIMSSQSDSFSSHLKYFFIGFSIY